MMDIFSVLSMIGGLAMFLYGMETMGDGLAKTAGGKLEHILEKLTSTPIKGVLLGAAVTAVIQSSSATTVMVVGFVNSGIMKLSQAVGIIMGANIGTTVTSWIVSLSGIESSNIVLQFLKPTSFCPILALIGIILLMFTKDEKKHDIGGILQPEFQNTAYQSTSPTKIFCVLPVFPYIVLRTGMKAHKCHKSQAAFCPYPAEIST